MQKYDLSIVDISIKGKKNYKLIKVKFPNLTSYMRRQILNKIMDDYKSDMMIELWSEGSIIYRPRNEVYYILICNSV
jgi:RNA-binding protein YhbY